MKISNRVSNINGENVSDDGWSVLYKARDMMDAGVSITNLSIGDHDTDTPGFVLDGMESSARSGNTRYAPIPGECVCDHRRSGRAFCRYDGHH